MLVVPSPYRSASFLDADIGKTELDATTRGFSLASSHLEYAIIWVYITQQILYEQTYHH